MYRPQDIFIDRSLNEYSWRHNSSHIFLKKSFVVFSVSDSDVIQYIHDVYINTFGLINYETN